MPTRLARAFVLVVSGVLPAAPVLAQSTPGEASPIPASVAVAESSTSAPYTWLGREDEIEAYLRSAPVTHFKDIPVGITKPQRGYFAPGGPVRSMAWKPLPEQVLHGKFESYRSEIAAYLLSRHLGLDMVPPVVERREKGVRGAAVYWVDGVAPWNPAAPPKFPGAKWSRQISRMHLFDQLIANIDRNQGNLLHDEVGYVYLIDHSRAFTSKVDLGGLKAPTQYDRELWDRMAALTPDDLKAVVGEWLSSTQREALLLRRDQIARQIERARRERGDRVVFLPSPVVVTAQHR